MTMTTTAASAPTHSEQSPVVRLSATVRGRVQGVGYRYFAHHAAHAIGGITGLVRNAPDGSVEVEAEAPNRGQLEQLLHDLHVGPGPAQVTEVTAIWEEATAPRHDGEFRVA